MKAEAQRIAIAVACPSVFRVIHGKVYWKNDDGLCDPLSDLNAMHEAEKVLTIHNWAAYEIELCDAIQSTGTDPDIWHHVLCATASQRAEAFLRATGLWKDDRIEVAAP